MKIFSGIVPLVVLAVAFAIARTQRALEVSGI